MVSFLTSLLEGLFRNQIAALFFSLLLVTTVVLTPRLVASGLTNRGYVLLSTALLDKNEAVDPSNRSLIRQAQECWQSSLELVVANPSAWYGLGFALVVTGQYSDTLGIWQHSRFEGVDFINLGDAARRDGDYDMALTWYQQAVSIAPELADPWYYKGLAYESLGEWHQALEAMHQALEKSKHKTVGWSSIHYHIGSLAQRRLIPPDIRQALTAYETALALDDFTYDQEQTHVHFSLGEILQQTGRETEAIQEYEWVITHQPDHYWAYVQLGVLHWQYNKDLAQSEHMLSQAIRLAPDVKWAYRWLGSIYQQAGKTEAANDMYLRVLEIDSTDDLAQGQLYRIENEP